MPIEAGTLGETRIALTQIIQLPLLDKQKADRYKAMAQAKNSFDSHELRMAVGELLSTLSKAEAHLKTQHRVLSAALRIVKKRWPPVHKPEVTTPSAMAE